MIDKDKKKKGKAHPFEGMLRDEEEIIWMSTPARPSLWKIIKSNLWTIQAIAFFFALATFMMPRSNFPHVTSADWLTLFLAVLGIETGLILLITIIVWLYRRYRRYECFYAITNERVLYSIKGMKRSIPLKSLPYIDLFSIDRGGRWNAYHPMWLTLEDAKRVVYLMEETKRRFEKAEPIA